jgi:hypothetical protein
VERIKILTVISDEEHNGFFLLKLSCAINNLELTSLVTPGGFKSNRIKDSVLVNYIEELDKDQIIFFTDGYDALFVANQDEIISKFKQHKRDLVFSTETNCWPDQNLASLYPENVLSPYRYLNSGGFIGKVGLLKELINDHLFSSEQFEKSNQYLWAKLFLQNQDLIGLDTSCNIFCSFSPEAGKDHLPKNGDNNYYHYYKFMKVWFQNNFISENNRIYNKTTNTWPCHVHFNGDSKILMDNDLKDTMLNRISKSRSIQTLYASY